MPIEKKHLYRSAISFEYGPTRKQPINHPFNVNHTNHGFKMEVLFFALATRKL